jgi:hypothetical protein
MAAAPGQVEGGVALLVDGEPTKLIDEAFDRTVTLRQGTNRIDLVGNVGVEKLEIVLDQEPPSWSRLRSPRTGPAAATA